MDLFSQLPQHDFIDHILSFLPPKEGARTSILSKSWKNAWNSCSSVALDPLLFKYNKEEFKEFMSKTLERYVSQGLGVEKLTITWATRIDDEDELLLTSMKQWMDFVFAPGNNLKQLIVSKAYSFDNIGFPLKLRASKTLTKIYLRRCTLENISENVEFPSLQDLTLIETPINSDIIHKTFLSGSPFLKSLSLIQCDGLESLEVSGLICLTTVSVRSSDSLKRVDIKAPNLRDFSFFGITTNSECDIKLAACDESLKKLTLHKLKLPTDDEYWLQTMVSRFVSLERLDLYGVYNNAHEEAIKISTPNLTKLVIRNCASFNEDTVINAPNLRSVKLADNKYPFYSLPNSNNLTKLKFYFGAVGNKLVSIVPWLPKLQELFSRNNDIFKDSTMNILCRQRHNKRVLGYLHYADQNILMVRELFNYELLSNIIKNLECQNYTFEVTIHTSSSSCEDWVERLFNSWTMPFSDALYIASSSHNTNFTKDFYESLFRCNSVSYCPDERTKCWKHWLKDIQMVNLNLKQKGSNSKRTKSKKGVKNKGMPSLNLEKDIVIEGQRINAALSQAYQALSYNLIRLTLRYYNDS